MASNLIKLIVPQPNRETIEEPTDIPPDEIKVTIVTAKEEIDRLKELRQQIVRIYMLVLSTENDTYKKDDTVYQGNEWKRL